MATLKYVGKPVVDDPDLANRGYVTSVKAADLSTEAIDQTINNGLNAYASKQSVDDGDSLLATPEYVAAGDETRLRLNQRGVAGGIAPLDATTKIPANFIDAPLTQRWTRGPWAPDGYHGSAIAVNNTEATLFPCTITDPGYPYRPMVFAQIDARTTLDTEWPVITVRAGDEVSGEIVARGFGLGDAYEASTIGDNFDRANSTTGLGSGWELTRIEGNDSGGTIGIINNEAYWVRGTQQPSAIMARRIDPDTANTATIWQRIVVNAGTSAGDNIFSDRIPKTRIYMRMNPARTQWVAWEITNGTSAGSGGNAQVRLVYVDNGAETQIGTITNTQVVPNIPWVAYAGDHEADDQRLFRLYRNGVLLKTVRDDAGVTAIGNTNRGWGFGMHAAQWAPQFDPFRITSIYVSDAVPNSGHVQVNPVNVGSLSVRTGPTTLYVRAARSGSAATVTVFPYRPRLWVLAIPA
ncbi:hypothetical protein BI081_gp120 [Mycobacterium phage Tonenili]|uniref:DUF7257 domain-containing protein n=1 Tax=Mycobacterium phage Tonenili TaxID=1891703 RepID=A0A1C9EHM0_9CAUD|nr:hypothetical protein BI081_gp120 [Mycobacterium phage Tonenili]AON96987.1 hypothetical protein SEA_TONENILI_269 [Mycobacterium phage Tonenili]